MRKQLAQDYSEIIYKNLKAISKIRGIPLGIFESLADVSQGYFSRKHRYTFNVIYTITQYLGITVEELINKDYTKELEVYKRQKRIKSLQDKIKDIQSEIDYMGENK